MRDNGLKLQPIIKMVILREKQKISVRSNRHDVTHLYTNVNQGDVLLGSEKVTHSVTEWN